MESILITGGTGMIGQHLTETLQHEGFRVSHLSRRPNGNRVRTFLWEVKKGVIDEAAIANADHIIHLAGANLYEKRWTTAFKTEIINSRIQSANLLYETLNKIPNRVKTFISASGINYYGNRDEEWLKETDTPGKDFLAGVCVKWEEVANRFSSLSKRTVSIRTGIVLSNAGGALPPLVRPVRFGIAPVFGNGNQFYSWIHIHDLCRMYLHAVKNEVMTGPYNGVAPSPERFKDFMSGIAKSLNRRKINIPVPMGLLKLMMGELVELLVFSARCSSKKTEETGFRFQYATLRESLQSLLSK